MRGPGHGGLGSAGGGGGGGFGGAGAMGRGGARGVAVPAGFDPSAAAAAQAVAATQAMVASTLSSRIPPHQFELARFVGHAGRIESIAVNHNGTTMVSGGHDFDILVWNLRDPAPSIATGLREERAIPVASPLLRIDAHRGHVPALAFCPADLAGGALLASGGKDHVVKLWRLEPSGLTGRLGASLEWAGDSADEFGHNAFVAAVAWGRGPSRGTLFSAGWDPAVKAWRADRAENRPAPNGKLGALSVGPVETMADHQARVTSIDVSRCGRFVVSVSADLTATLRSAVGPTFTLLAKYVCTSYDGALTAVAAGQSYFATASDNGQLRIWPFPGIHSAWDQAYFKDPMQAVAGLTSAAAAATSSIAVGGPAEEARADLGVGELPVSADATASLAAPRDA